MESQFKLSAFSIYLPGGDLIHGYEKCSDNSIKSMAS